MPDTFLAHGTQSVSVSSGPFVRPVQVVSIPHGYATLCPLQVGFSTPRPDILTPLNYGIDILFAMDICFNYRTAYYDRTASLVGSISCIFRLTQRGQQSER
eukprot:1153698-Pelagomonas_calceolata.AAC.5